MIIYGSYFSGKDLEKLIPIDESAHQLLQDKNIDVCEIVKKMINNSDIIIHNYYGYSMQYNIVYIGRDWDDIKDDETGKGFKDSVKNALEKLFNKEIVCRSMRVKGDNYDN